MTSELQRDRVRRPEIVFEDGLGPRYRWTSGADPEYTGIEMHLLRASVAGAPAFEFALRERVARLAKFHHPAFPALHGVERGQGKPPELLLFSEAAAGTRLSVLLEDAYTGGVSLDCEAALSLLRQLVDAMAALHSFGLDVSHGALATERLHIVAPDRLVVVDHALAAALQQLRYPAEQYWSELGVAVPPVPQPPVFDQRLDVVQIGALGVALLRGAPLQAAEWQGDLAEALGATRALTADGQSIPLPPGIRGWLARALQLNPLYAFSSAVDAKDALDALLEERGGADRTRLAAFLSRCSGESAPFWNPDDEYPRALTPPGGPSPVELAVDEVEPSGDERTPEMHAALQRSEATAEPSCAQLPATPQLAPVLRSSAEHRAEPSEPTAVGGAPPSSESGAGTGVEAGTEAACHATPEGRSPALTEADDVMAPALGESLAPMSEPLAEPSASLLRGESFPGIDSVERDISAVSELPADAPPPTEVPPDEAPPVEAPPVEAPLVGPSHAGVPHAEATQVEATNAESLPHGETAFAGPVDESVAPAAYAESDLPQSREEGQRWRRDEERVDAAPRGISQRRADESPSEDEAFDLVEALAAEDWRHTTPDTSHAKEEPLPEPDLFGIDARLANSPIESGTLDVTVRAAGETARVRRRVRLLGGFIGLFCVGATSGVVFAWSEPVKVAPLALGTVTLWSAPTGVDAYVNNAYRGITPLKLVLPPGAHVVEVRGESSRRLRIMVSPGLTVSQFVELPNSGQPVTTERSEAGVASDVSEPASTVSGEGITETDAAAPIVLHEADATAAP